MALTRYPEGSFRELLKIALPLMISSLSVMSMVFVDRLLLAHYSSAALNAAANAATFGWAFIFGWMVLTSIAEVFVAQYNGAGQKHKLGEPVWQMIWLSLFAVLFFIPLGIWGSDWVYNCAPDRHLEQQYFKWMILFGPSYPIYSALCGFFVGQGKTTLVTWLAIAANVLNAVLDVILIFGVEGVLDPMGVKGAAIGTSIGSIFQVLILGWFFLNKSNRETCGSGNWAINWQAMWQCIRIGVPSAIFVTVEILGWASYYYMMTLVSERHITVAAISQSIIILLYFFSEGVSKATSIVTGNLIGAKRSELIPKVIRSGTLLHTLFFVVLVIGLVAGSDFIIMQFLPLATPETIASMHATLKICLAMVSVYMLFEGLRMLFSGVLTAAGDTFFLLTAGSLSVWLLLVAPVYYFVVVQHMSIEVASIICVVYSFGACLLYMWRFRTGTWKGITITA